MVSVRRVAPVLLLLVAVPLFAANGKSSTTPPRDLHKVGDHWTAYDPPDPSTYPPGAKTHTIKAGDTLWALAQSYYGNAYLWPQLWEMNSWITDAHWIYPGDVLLVQGEAVAEAEQQPTMLGTSEPEAETPAAPTAAVTAGSSPIPIASESDLYCYGYIGDPREPMPNRIESFEDVEILHQEGVIRQGMSVSAGDLVFVNGGTSTGIQAGETYLLVEPGVMVTHPVSKAAMGQHYEFIGQIRILCADEVRSRAIITQSCREVYIGTRLKPLPQLPIPIARVPDLPTICDAPSGRSNGYIVDSRDRFNVGVGDLVQIDLGRDDQIQPGDFMTVYRDSSVIGQNREILGEIGILTTEGRTATARIVSMRRTMKIGDKVEMR